MRVVAAVLPGEREGEVLAFRRGPGLRHAGLWEFPGGKAEPGEDDAAALARELWEELAVRVEVGVRLWAGLVATGETALDMRFFACRLLAGTLVLSDHDAMASVGGEGLATLAWAPGDVPFVAWLGRRSEA